MNDFMINEERRIVRLVCQLDAQGAVPLNGTCSESQKSSFRPQVILNEVKDLMPGRRLHKLNRVTHDRGRGPSRLRKSYGAAGASLGMTRVGASGNLNAPCLWIGSEFLPRLGRVGAVA